MTYFLLLLVLVSGACADIPEIMELKTEIQFLKHKMMNQEDEFKFLQTKMMTEIGSLKQQIAGNNDVSNHPSDSLLLK